MVADFMFCKRSRMKGFENLVRKAKLQTASKHQKQSLKNIKTSKAVPKKHRDSEKLQFCKTRCMDVITLSYYVFLLLLWEENSNGS